MLIRLIILVPGKAMQRGGGQSKGRFQTFLQGWRKVKLTNIQRWGGGQNNEKGGKAKGRFQTVPVLSPVSLK